MSAIELMEQLGTNASLQRQDLSHVAEKHNLAMQLMEQEFETPEKQWCILVPAEEEPSDGDDSETPETDTISNNETKIVN